MTREVESRVRLLSLALFVSLVIFSTTPRASAATSQATNSTSFSTSNQPAGKITVITSIVPRYSAFSLSETQRINANISLTSLDITNGSLPISFVASFSPDHITADVLLQNHAQLKLPVTTISGTFGTSIAYYVNLPNGTQNVDILVSGSQGAESILWRYISGVAFLYLRGINIPISFSYVLDLSHGNIISHAYTGSEDIYHGNSLPVPSVISSSPNSGISYSITGPVSTIVIQSKSFVPLSIGLTAVLLVLITLVSVGLMRSGRRFFSQILERTHLGVLIRYVVRLGALLVSIISGTLLKISGAQKNATIRSRITSRNALILFVICGLLMISLAAVGGPDPQPKAYVVAAPSQIGPIRNTLDSLYHANVQVITPSQDYSDFNVMSSIGMFNIVVISNYPSYAVGEVSGFIAPNLMNVPLIVIDSTANSNFTAQAEAINSGHIISVTNAANLTPSEASTLRNYISCCAHLRPNLLGLNLSVSNFHRILALEGALSFVVIFLGWAFLGLKAAEPSSETILAHFASIIGIGLFVFFFSQTAYVATSSILTFPLSLHAVVSGAKGITAVGLLGFYGGSTPRLLAAAAGLLIGALAVGWRVRFSPKSFVLILASIVVIMVNPFSIGNFAFQSVTILIGSIPLGGAYLDILSLKSFLYGVGGWVGGNVSPTYLMSAGKILGFAGLVPLAFLNKMGKVTATLALLFVLPVLGHGAVRVGEMTPDKTLIAVMPGLMIGFVFAFIFLSISMMEKYVARRYVK